MSQKIALVLSSGGARGLAHIGVIEELEQQGYEITAVAGCSMGALVGAFYACGELEKYKKWALELDRMDVFSLIDFTFSTQGFIKGEKVFKNLEQLIPDREISSFRIPFAAVATDILQKKEVLFTSGSMYQAVKASVAIPTVIKPVPWNGKDLIDGGVMNPLPIRHVQRQSGDLLVVSNVNANIPYERAPKATKKEQQKQAEAERSYNQKIQQFLSRWNKLLPGGDSDNPKKPGFFDLLNQSIDLMQDTLTQLILEKHQPDVHIRISREACSTFEFYKADELIATGRAAVKKALSIERDSTS